MDLHHMYSVLRRAPLIGGPVWRQKLGSECSMRSKTKAYLSDRPNLHMVSISDDIAEKKRTCEDESEPHSRAMENRTVNERNFN